MYTLYILLLRRWYSLGASSWGLFAPWKLDGGGAEFWWWCCTGGGGVDSLPLSWCCSRTESKGNLVSDELLVLLWPFVAFPGTISIPPPPPPPLPLPLPLPLPRPRPRLPLGPASVNGPSRVSRWTCLPADEFETPPHSSPLFVLLLFVLIWVLQQKKCLT